MKHISATQFEKRCLSILDRLGPDGIIVTKRGRAVAKVLPEGAPADLIGALRGKIRVRGNIISSKVKWAASN